MIISFPYTPTLVPHFTIGGEEIERIAICTLRVISLDDSLSWQNHVVKVHKKAGQRRNFISQLKRTKIPSSDRVKVYLSLVCPGVEYACQLWHAGLNGHY